MSFRSSLQRFCPISSDMPSPWRSHKRFVGRQPTAMSGWDTRAGRGLSVLMTVAVIALTGPVGCRSARPLKTPGPRAVPPNAVPASPEQVESILRTEVGAMAVDDQARAAQAAKRVLNTDYPYRDDPIKPVFPP